MTIFDVPTVTLPAEGEIGLVDIGPLTLAKSLVSARALTDSSVKM